MEMLDYITQKQAIEKEISSLKILLKEKEKALQSLAQKQVCVLTPNAI